MRHPHLLAALALAGLTACPETDLIPCDNYPGLCNEQQVAAALQPAANCEEMEALVHRNAVESMRANLLQQLTYMLEPRWCLPNPFDAFSPRTMASEDSGAGGASQYSTTNVQEQGVDEADFVKNDGQFIYLLSGGRFVVLKAWPAAETHELGAFALEGRPRSLFVHGDRALIYSDIAPEGSSSDPYGRYGYSYGGYCWQDGSNGFTCTGDTTLRITLLDLSDRAAPALVRSIDVEGSFFGARRIGSAVFTTVAKGRRDDGLRYWSDDVDPCFSSREAILDAYYQLFLDNQARIEATPANNWMVGVADRRFGAGGATLDTSAGQGCGDYYAPALPGGDATIAVVGLDMLSDTPAHLTAISGQPGIVYASHDALYLATPTTRTVRGPWFLGFASEIQEATLLHRFALDASAASARYSQGGVVAGRVINQFSLGEHNGHLRLATTQGFVARGGGTSSNDVFVLEPQGAELAVVGRVEGLGRGEDIRSARFLGDKGYVVTFKKTDPLFVLDLADARNPRLLGELQIPGFSTYLHPMDATHLLTIGFDAADQGDFAWFTGLQLQIFDVTDPTRPSLLHKHLIGTRGSSSEATGNHLAFNYFAPLDLLALPMTICEGGDSNGGYGSHLTFSGLMVLDVTLEGGFAERGRVSHPVATEAGNYYGGGCYSWWQDANSEVQRSIVMDNWVFSISSQALKVNNLDNLGTDAVSLPLQGLPTDVTY